MGYVREIDSGERTMNETIKYCFLSFVVFFLFSSNCFGLDIAALDAVRNKDLLQDSDFEVIDQWMSEAIGELVKTEDFTDIARLRTRIVVRKESIKASSRAQYNKGFYTSAKKYIGQALLSAQSLEDEKLKFQIALNLMILIGELGDIQLADIMIDKLNDENAAIRYWAVNYVAGEGVIEKLNSDPQYQGLAMIVCNRLESIIGRSLPGVTVLIANFASRLELARGGELLIKLADLRIKDYSEWKVSNEMIDSIVLKSLYEKMSSQTGNSAVGERFAQLFSFVIQRYINGQEILNETEKQNLVSIMVEIEDKCIKKMFGTQATIKSALEKKDLAALWREHNILLGDENREGKIGLKYQFMYTRAGGLKSSAPAVLPAPPEGTGNQDV